MLQWLSLHWGDVVPTWLAVIVAVFFGVQSWRSSRQSKAARDEAEAQADRAERATKAAQDAADAAERSATAHEKQAQLAWDQADEAQAKPWRIMRPTAHEFFLQNLTRTAKYDVAVTGQPAVSLPGVFRPGGGRSNCYEVVDGAETVELNLIIAAQTKDRSVTVSWRPARDHTGDPWTQRIGLPS